MLNFTVFNMPERVSCSFTLNLFLGRSLSGGLSVASPRYPPGFSLLSLTLYAPAMPEERYDDFFMN